MKNITIFIKENYFPIIVIIVLLTLVECLNLKSEYDNNKMFTENEKKIKFDDSIAAFNDFKNRIQHELDSIHHSPEYIAKIKADSINKVHQKMEEEIRLKPLRGLMNRFNINEYVAQRVKDREIWIGMPIKIVFYYRGGYNSKNISNYGNGNEYQFCWYDYTPSCFYCSEDGIVTSYN
jgi:hypothetical protein